MYFFFAKLRGGECWFPIAIDVAHSGEKWWRVYINFNTTF